MMKVKILLAVVVCLFLVGAVKGQPSLLVDEAEIGAVSGDGGLQIGLTVRSAYRKPVAAYVRLEVIDAYDTIIAQTEIPETIERGQDVLQIPVKFGGKIDIKNMLWHRLRYAVIPFDAERKSAVKGIVSLSEILNEVFELRVSTSEIIYSGMRYSARVHAFHPTKNFPVSSVKINAELEVDLQTDGENDEIKLKATGETDEEGYAVLEFEIPDRLSSSENLYGEIRITGEKNNLVSRASESVQTVRNAISVYFSTDKPIYQPNQKIYVRGLALRSRASETAMTVAAGKDFEFQIKDEEGTTLYSQTVKTSRFGIAAIDWQIPESAKLGTYKIMVKSDENLGNAETSFKVSRYDLPNFVVQTKSDRDFYLPGQNTAEVTIDALYLFGKPVTGGKVRIVEESSRRWNYGEQKWDISEERVFEGETDAEGKYVAKIDLSKTQESLSGNTDEAFKDLTFAAYFTDSTTNKTEQRRFDVRVTREPVHVYLIGKKNNNEYNPKIPLSFYVSTFSADGKPLACDVEVKGKYEGERQEKVLGRVKTNAFGAGKIQFSAPKSRSDDKDLELNISARDAENRTGKKIDELQFDSSEKQIFVRTDKTIYRKGEAMKVEILSTESDGSVFVDVSKNLSHLDARRIKLKNGRAELKIPYKEDFKNNLTLSAYFEDGSQAVMDSRGVFFPTPKNLRVDADMEKDTFRPNEEATVNFSVSSPGNPSAENALGVVVLDKAVEERARTDADFGGVDVFQSFSGLLGFTGGFGGVTRATLEELDMKQPVSKDLQLAAEIMFHNTYFNPNFFDSNYQRNTQYIFYEKSRRQFEPIQNVLWKRYGKNYEHPTDEASLRKILGEEGVDFDELRDPWGNKYRVQVYSERGYDSIYFWSNGANKRYEENRTDGRHDDFMVFQLNFQYFAPTGYKINSAVNEFVQKTGKAVRDKETLREALKLQEINLDALKDRWGEPYKIEFGGDQRYHIIYFNSGGADKKFSGNYFDDFTIWTNYTNYFASVESKMRMILDKYAAEKNTYPKNESELKQVLKDGGLDFDTLRDGWNRPYYLTFTVSPRNGYRTSIEKVAKQGEAAKENIKVTPVVQEVAVFTIQSLGANGVKDNSWDDYAGMLVGVVSEKVNEEAKVVVPKSAFADGKSAIYGVVTDQNGAVIPNASVKLTNIATQVAFTMNTDDEGAYMQTSLAAGKYSVEVTVPGFKTSVVTEIKVEMARLVEINMAMEAGTPSATVTVSSDSAVSIDTTDTKINTSISQNLIENLPRGTQFSSLLRIAPNLRSGTLSGGFQIDGASGSENGFIVDGQEVRNFRSGAQNEQNELPSNQRKSTPRLREYFPETLVWMPEIVTNKDGKAALKFRLADNITTWKIYAIASDEKGNVGITQKEFKAFQPFFVDLEPPKFLTTGDEIALPVQVRNYTKDKQRVDVSMARADWFSFLDAENRQIEVDASASQNAVFNFRAERAADDGRQKVTAIADTDSDAIERSVTVRPNGQEIVKTDSELFNQSVAFDVNFPANALPETQKAELKIYPNLLSHVTDSVGGLLQRPYGCGEQTISSTYPNLMILKFMKDDARLSQAAHIYLKKGYERLLGYQVAEGGISYWGGKESPNIALTAYALRFLNDAKAFIKVDENAVKRAQDWLVKQQRADGSFVKYNSESDAKATKMFTAYVARILAMSKQKDEVVLQKALAYLKTRTSEADEPYTLALFGLASIDAGNIETARDVVKKLEKTAISEQISAHWKLEGSTPFYGWGSVGQIETTAVVLQFLMRQTQAERTENSAINSLIAKATLYLLEKKDRYGVWYSTQTTINVLDAFLAALSENSKNKNQTLQVFLNGENVQSLSLATGKFEPIFVDLKGKLNASANRVEIKGSANSLLMAQIVSTHYIDWRDANISNQTNFMRLNYTCDKQNAQIMEEINCTVEAERLGYNNYGMLLAEIGLPPGADVSRESLQKARDADSHLSRYDVLPDRIILYMWSKPGGIRFNFKFRPRYGINAQTPPSILYDYYNEEAKATLAPLKFEVK